MVGVASSLAEGSGRPCRGAKGCREGFASLWCPPISLTTSLAPPIDAAIHYKTARLACQRLHATTGVMAVAEAHLMYEGSRTPGGGGVSRECAGSADRDDGANLGADRSP